MPDLGTIGSADVEIRVKLDKFQQEIEAATQALQRFTQSMDKPQEQVSKFGKGTEAAAATTKAFHVSLSEAGDELKKFGGGLETNYQLLKQYVELDRSAKSEGFLSAIKSHLDVIGVLVSMFKTGQSLVEDFDKTLVATFGGATLDQIHRYDQALLNVGVSSTHITDVFKKLGDNVGMVDKTLEALVSVGKFGDFEKTTLKEVANAESLNEKFRALAKLITDASSQGERLAALTLAKTILPDELYKKLVTTPGVLADIVKKMDEASRISMISQENVKRAGELKRQLDDSYDVISTDINEATAKWNAVSLGTYSLWVDTVSILAKAWDWLHKSSEEAENLTAEQRKQNELAEQQNELEEQYHREQAGRALGGFAAGAGVGGVVAGVGAAVAGGPITLIATVGALAVGAIVGITAALTTAKKSTEDWQKAIDQLETKAKELPRVVDWLQIVQGQKQHIEQTKAEIAVTGKNAVEQARFKEASSLTAQAFKALNIEGKSYEEKLANLTRLWPEAINQINELADAEEKLARARAQANWDKEIKSLSQHIAALQTEAAAVGKSAQENERMKSMLDSLNKAFQIGGGTVRISAQGYEQLSKAAAALAGSGDKTAVEVALLNKMLEASGSTVKITATQYERMKIAAEETGAAVGKLDWSRYAQQMKLHLQTQLEESAAADKGAVAQAGLKTRVEATAAAIKAHGVVTDEDKKQIDQWVAQEEKATRAMLSKEWQKEIDNIGRHIGAMKAEEESIGKSAGALEGLRIKYQLLELVRNRDHLSSTEEVRLNETQKRQMDDLSKGAEKEAAAKEKVTIAYDLSKAREELMLGTQEADIVKKLTKLYGDDYPRALASSEAAQMRFNDAIKEVQSTGQTFVTSFVMGMRQGETAIKSVMNALNKLADKLLEMATQAVYQKLFGQLLSIGLGGGVGAETVGPLGLTPLTLGGVQGAVGVHASGGTVGASSGEQRRVPMGIFMGAPKFQLGTDEVPIIAHAGEQITPKGASPPAVHNNFMVENHGADIQTSRKKNQSGGMDIRMVVRKMVSDDFAGGHYDGVLGQRMGLRPQTARR
jgi:hypothetical protein